MSPVGAIFVPFPPKTGTNMLHPPPNRWNDVQNTRILRFSRAPRRSVGFLVVKLLVPWRSPTTDRPFKAGLASESQRINRYKRRNISLEPSSCRLILQSSTLQNTLQPRPALTWTSSQSNARHDPKNGQARKQIRIPLVHEVLGRCPSRIFLSDDKLKIGERKLLEQRL